MHGFGFSRAALAKKDGQHDDRSDGEELALPVLERLMGGFVLLTIFLLQRGSTRIEAGTRRPPG